MEVKGKTLESRILPSHERTRSAVSNGLLGETPENIINCSLVLENREGICNEDYSNTPLVQKNDEGTIVSGLQSEQLALVLLDRTKKLDDRFPSEYNKKMIEGLEMFLGACEARVQDRIDRGVMGKLEK